MKIALIAGWGMNQDVWSLAILQNPNDEFHVFDVTSEQPKKNNFDYVIGWSLGGVIALNWALHGEAKVVLLASLPIMVQRDDFAGGIDQQAFTEFSQLYKRDKPAALQHFVKLQTLGCAQPRALQKKINAHLLSSPSDLNQLAAADARAAWQILQQQQRLQAVYAQDDKLLTAKAVNQALAQLPPIPTHWIDGGHAECIASPQKWLSLL